MQTNAKHMTHWLTLVAGSVVVLASSGAWAQAGGGGRILERDLRTGAGNQGLTARPNFGDEVRLRNALVTGNVGGLRSFRGNVGYRAPGEFGSSLGSDSTFSFRRDSSSAATLRGVDSLRYQTTFSTGNGSDLISRLGATGSAAASAAPGTADTAFNSRVSNMFRPRTGSLRSTSSFTANQSLNPTLLSFTQGEDGTSTKTMASSLLGVRTLRDRLASIGVAMIGPATTDAFGNPLPGSQNLNNTSDGRSRTPETTGTGLTPQSVVSKAMDGPANAVNLPSSQNLQKPLSRSAFDDLRDRMKKADEDARAAKLAAPRDVAAKVTDGASDVTSPEVKELTVDQRLERLRERLVPNSARLRDAKGRTLSDRAREIEEAKRLAQQSGLSEEEAAAQASKGRLTQEDLETIDIIRRASAKANTFVDPTTGERDFYAEHMARGEELLGQGRYFDAEERFAMALSQKPGDVSAQSARIHAQLGAGLYLSAALNLRTLLAAHPEVAGLRYEGNTIPKAERLRSIAAELRGNVQGAADRKQQPLSADGLLLAYVGWQLEDYPMVGEGLGIAKSGVRSSAEQQAVSADQSEMIALLERVWLGKQ